MTLFRTTARIKSLLYFNNKFPELISYSISIDLYHRQVGPFGTEGPKTRIAFHVINTPMWIKPDGLGPQSTPDSVRRQIDKYSEQFRAVLHSRVSCSRVSRGRSAELCTSRLPLNALSVASSAPPRESLAKDHLRNAVLQGIC